MPRGSPIPVFSSAPVNRRPESPLKGDLYFNLYYNDLDQAFRRGHEQIHLGQDSDDFKMRLGSRPRALSFYVRAPNPVFQAGLRGFSRLIFPKVPSVRDHNVLKKTTAGNALAP